MCSSCSSQVDFIGGSFTNEWICRNPVLLFTQRCRCEDLGSRAHSITSHLLTRHGMVILLLSSVYYGLTIIAFLSLKSGKEYLFSWHLFHEKSQEKQPHIFYFGFTSFPQILIYRNVAIQRDSCVFWKCACAVYVQFGFRMEISIMEFHGL